MAPKKRRGRTMARQGSRRGKRARRCGQGW
uniref:Uncharacterized protein n=1 Tax=Arundo donax TaxID=35708 RepID=A0A0A9AZ41_ARUDO